MTLRAPESSAPVQAKRSIWLALLPCAALLIVAAILVRRLPRNPQERYWRPKDPSEELLSGVDALIHLAGASIAGRFTPARKREIFDSRIVPTRRLAELAAVSATGEGIRQTSARLFRRLQSRYAELRAAWLADWLERELLGELLAELQAGAVVAQSPAMRTAAQYHCGCPACRTR